MVAKHRGHSVDTVLVEGSSAKVRIVAIYLAAIIDDAVEPEPHGLTDYYSLENCSFIGIFDRFVCEMCNCSAGLDENLSQPN